MRFGSIRHLQRFALRRDVALGLGLCGLFAVVLPLTAGALHEAGTTPPVPVVVVAMLVAVAGILAAAVAQRGSVWRLLLFPLILFGGEVALAGTTDGFAPTYVGFITLAILYTGVTQPRRALAVAIAVGAPTWLVGQEALTPPIVLRFCVIVAIWLLAGGAVALRAARHRSERATLIARATTDGLTALSSREALAQMVERDLHTPGLPSSLMLLDLDGFKAVNDMFGHDAGDDLLVATAERIRSSVRPGDVCARLGGDEFAVLLRRTSLHDATTVAKRLVRQLAEPITLTRGRMAVTASIGVVGLDGLEDADAAFHDADLAMYDAKSAGRNQVSVFRQEISERRNTRVQLERELRAAVERGEFELYYQPLVRLDTAEIVAVEALLRWNHPQRGVLGPDAFLTAAEEIGVLEKLDDWVLLEACRQAVAWQPADPGRALTVAVNLSAPQLLAEDFADRLDDILGGTGLQPHLLVLELSERLVLSDAPLIRDRIAEVRRRGVRLAMDDFGTGYSSLAYLRQLPVDILKIDQSFVHPLGSGRQALALVKSIVAIAEALDLSVIAEGVETDTQATILSELGCEVAQGYHFVRPSPVADIAALLDAARASLRSLPQ